MDRREGFTLTLGLCFDVNGDVAKQIARCNEVHVLWCDADPAFVCEQLASGEVPDVVLVPLNWPHTAAVQETISTHGLHTEILAAAAKIKAQVKRLAVNKIKAVRAESSGSGAPAPAPELAKA